MPSPVSVPEVTSLLHLTVYVPGPWWHGLTYGSSRPVAPGTRVAVSLAGRRRVGVVASSTPEDESASYTVLPVKRTLERVPAVGRSALRLAEQLGALYLCGAPMALGAMLPAFLFRADADDDWTPLRNGAAQSDPPPEEPFLLYEPLDQLRHQRLRERLAAVDGSALALFPEQRSAECFFASLPERLKRDAILWPSTKGGKALRAAWRRVRNGEVRTVVGGQSAVFAPLPGIGAVLVDEEASGGHVRQEHPHFHTRTVAALRARLEGAALTVAGRMPSSRIYQSWKPANPRLPGKRLRHVDLREAYNLLAPGIRDGLAVTEPVLGTTQERLSRNETVLWILDRKGFSGEVSCADCSYVLHCSRCGIPMVAGGTGGRLRCPLCGREEAFPERCPRCGGVVLEGKRPGLEAFAPLAEALLGDRLPLHTWYAEKTYGVREWRRLVGDLADGGLVLGTRRALALCDELAVGAVCWIDADGEARRPWYDARFKAFSMIWESLWRGICPENREVVLQTWRPGREWQGMLGGGWERFWNRELEERRELEHPPYSTLVQLFCVSAEQKRGCMERFMERGLVPLEPESAHHELWCHTSRLARLREALEPFFSMRRESARFPRVRLWRE
ncbi:MAG: hypothetical protein K9L28_01485 [Synergistales bacterium]|nr:hypothetical protein [Synergistales bacterium]